MRTYGAINFLSEDAAPLPPDTVATFLMTGGSSAQASDWFSSGSTALNQAGSTTPGPQIVRFTGITSVGSSLFNFMVNFYSTLAAAAPASGTTVGMGVSSGVSVPITGSRMFQVPGQSTGYSIAALTSGTVYVEMWRK